MSMDGNPTHGPAYNRLNQIHTSFMNGEENTVPNTLALAQVEATLALAYEQRTANLLAAHHTAVMAALSDNSVIEDAVDMTRNLASLTNQIKERMEARHETH